MDEKARSIEVYGNSIIITLSPSLYSKNAVMRAAYRMLGNCSARVLGDGINSLSVELRVLDDDGRVDKEDLVDAFFAELLQAEMEEINMRKFGDVRKMLLELAIRGLAAGKNANVGQNQDNKGEVNEEERIV